VLRGGLGSKGLCDIPYKKIEKVPKIPPKGSFLTFYNNATKKLKNECDFEFL
jgi:hypothetical protein